MIHDIFDENFVIKTLDLNPDPKHWFEVKHVPGNGLRQLVRIFWRGMPTADDVAVP